MIDIEAEDMLFALPNDYEEVLLNKEVLHYRTRLQNYDVLYYSVQAIFSVQ